MRKLSILIVLGSLIATAPALADRTRDHRRDDRREERRERREERQERREDRQERRERRQDRREWREERRDHRLHDHRPSRPPPGLRAERWAPRRGFVWVNGHWDWQAGNWVWISGRYERERRGQRWRDRRWEQRDGAYVVVDGGWISVGPSSAPPPVRVERFSARPGFIWVRGHWNWQGDNWVWVAGHYERERANAYYREPRWEQRNGAWISVEGSWVVR